MKRSRALALVVLAASIATLLGACSAFPSVGGSTPTPSASSGYGSAPSWARPLSTPGKLLNSASGTNFKVDVYQVATAIAAGNGQFVDPQTGKPIIQSGDKIVYVNYVFTNTGKTSIALGFDLAGVEPRYADWPYLQGMDSVVDANQYKTMHVNPSAFGPSPGNPPYEWKAGTSFSYGENFKYESNSAISFTVTLTPATKSGDPDFAKRQIVTTNSTIS